MNHQESGNAFARSGQIYLADVVKALEVCPSLNERRRSELRCSIRSIGKWMGRDLSKIPANQGYLRRLFKDFYPEPAGISRKRFQNAVSDLRAALRLVDPKAGCDSYLSPMAPAWRSLFDALPSRFDCCSLARFFRFCSAQGIAPEHVDDVAATAFRTALEEELLLRDPGVLHRTMIRAWNRMRSQVPGWPETRLTAPSTRQPYGLRWSSFPTSLQAEAQAYVDALSGKDLLADNIPDRPVKARTAQIRLAQIRWFASALVHRGHAPGAISGLAYLVRLENFKDGLKFFLDRNDNKESRFIGEMAYAIRTIGLKWLGAEGNHKRELQRIYRRLAVHPIGLTEKNRQCVIQFDDLENSRRLLFLPEVEIGRIERKPMPSWHDARRVQTAVALAILLAAPMRIGNLAALNLVTHLRWLGRDEDQSLLISIPRHEVKNAEALEHEMRGEVAGLVRLYVDKYRPMMNLNGSDWLFPGRFAGPKSTSTLRQQIVRLIRTATGLRLTPHQVRHIIAKLFLDRRPGEYEVVRRILGHKSAETTYQFYSGAETRAAQRHFDKTILNLKNELSADARHARDNHVAQR